MSAKAAEALRKKKEQQAEDHPDRARAGPARSACLAGAEDIQVSDRGCGDATAAPRRHDHHADDDRAHPRGSSRVPDERGNLPDSDPLISPGSGQLVVFSRFVSKDPFRAKPTISVDDPSDQPTGAATGATIEVNGASDEVKVGETFPESDGAFRLVAVGTDTAEIGLASGTFSNGQETMALKIGEELILVSEPDGTRYAIKLIGVS